MILFPATAAMQSLVWQAGFGVILWLLVAGAFAKRRAVRPAKGNLT
jgi:hypothetical protein